MEDFLDFDLCTPERVTSVRQPPRPELAPSETIDIYHWAAVALVTALMCAVLGYAAGTPTLSRAANVTSIVFGVLGGALTASGIARRVQRVRSRAIGA